MPRQDRMQFDPEEGKPTVKFIQIIAINYTYGDDGQQGASVVALGDNGVVYQYRKGDINAWLPYNTDILRKA